MDKYFTKPETIKKNILYFFISAGLLGSIFFLGDYFTTYSDKFLFISFMITIGIFYKAAEFSENNYKQITFILLGSIIFALCAFWPGKKEDVYILQNHINATIRLFILFFIAIHIIIYYKKLIIKSTEGFTLLQSLTFLYWIIANRFTSQRTFILLAIILPFVGYSLYHAFSYKELSSITKLRLSIWSYIITLIFSLEFLIRTSIMYTRVSLTTTENYINFGIEAFLFGISILYTIQCLYMVIGFMRLGQKESKNDYKERIINLKQDHINRYSNKQVKVGYSIFAIVFASTIFISNYYYHFTSKQTAIIGVLLIFPMLINIYEWIEYTIKDNTISSS